jgi:uncharacterized protein YegL
MVFSGFNFHLCRFICADLLIKRQMEAMKQEAIVAFNQFLKEQRAVPGDVRLTLILFDNEYLKPHDCIDLADVPDLDDKTYIPRGGTALLDAMGRTIDELGQRLAKTPEADRPGKVIIACMTDGEENSSCQYSNDKVSRMIKHQREKYSWDVIFLGATIGSRRMARSWSVSQDDCITMEAGSQGLRMGMRAVSKKLIEKRSEK